MSTFERPRSAWRGVLRSFVLTVLVAGALYSGYFFFSTVRALVAQTSLPFVDSVASDKSIPGRAPASELPNIAEKKERINILLLGIDQREGETGPFRTDTMILVGIDPATNAISMLSIPRDLWVRIPGYGENRINTAHSTGDAESYPGGGVALAKKTVAQNLGVPVHYYVRINFSGFEQLIDAIGGLDINVVTAIHDETYPTEDYGTMVLDIPAGLQHMDGAAVLRYARSRHGTGDFDRMDRQQAVIRAALDKVLGLDIPITRWPKLVELAGDSVKTDLTLDEIRELAPLAKDLNTSTIQSGVIDDSMTISSTTPQGAMVEVPDWEKINPLVEQLFPTAAAAASLASETARARLVNEDAGIEVLNGTLVSDLAQETSATLASQGFNIVHLGNAERLDYAETWLVAYSDVPHTLASLADALNVPAERIRRETSATSQVDIRVILGRDRVRQGD
jgi:LCP family protein required for cell wall assembly